MANATQEKHAPDQKRHGRSPAYPGIPLKKALDQALALYKAEGKYAVPLASAFKAWGFGEKSSGGRETKAALRYFGLTTADGNGNKIKLTEKALRVLLDEREDQTEKNALIREMALAPSIHREIKEKFAEGIKSDATVKHFLVFEKGFNESAAEELIDEFKATASFSGLFEPATLMVKVAENRKTSEKPGELVSVGDIIQWLPSGLAQFNPPRRVRVLSEDGQWVFVEGSETGLPMSEVEVITRGEGSTGNQPIPPILPLDTTPKGSRKEVFALDEGDVVLIFPENLSADSFDDLKAYFDVFLRKAQRRAKA